MALTDFIQYEVPAQDACESFGSCAVHRRYPNAVRVVGESGQRGCATETPIKIDIQPSTGLQSGEKLMLEKEGHIAESTYKFFFNPHHPENVSANSGDPLFLVTGDSRFVTEGFDSSTLIHGDVIEWMGETFLICIVQNWAGETCLGENCNVIDHQSGFLSRWKDKNHERLATLENDTFVNDGVIVK